VQGKLSILILIGILISGCAKPTEQVVFEESTQFQLERPDPQFENGRLQSLKILHFGGLYAIKEVKPREHAMDLARGQFPDRATFQDGAIRISFRPVPFGVSVTVQNLLPYAVTLSASRCAMVDQHNIAHPVELRAPEHLYPSREAGAQDCRIPPGAGCVMDLDVVMPVFRSMINEQCRSIEERGAFLLARSPLPVFSSGYYVYGNSTPQIDAVEDWATGKNFLVDIEFFAEPGGRPQLLGYTFTITPIRFSVGPKFDPQLWQNPDPSPFPLK
jgi:hypothetical protein